MKIMHTVDAFGRFTLTPEPGVYDATPPAPDLLVDAQIADVSPSRLALAEALVYMTSIGADLQVDAEFHPATAEILSHVDPNSWIHAHPIRFEPADIPTGSISVAVSDQEGFPNTSNHSTCGADIQVTLLRADEYAGQLSSLRHRWITTNADLVGNSHDVYRDRLHRRLSTLLILSDELDVFQYQVPGSWFENINEPQIYIRLLRTVGISIVIDSIRKAAIS